MKAITGKILPVLALTGALFSPALPLLAQTAPPPAPPLPPLPPVQPSTQPFNVLTPPGFTQPAFNPPGPAVVPAAPNPAITIAPPASNFGQLEAFTWDAPEKEVNSKPGDATANYTFWFTNISPAEVVINAIRTSCGCTVAKMPVTPWPIPAGSNGPVEVTIDLRGKSGAIAKAVTVESTAGTKSLICKVNIPTGAAATDFTVNHPQMGDTERLKNMQDSLKDRQVVFKDAKCATCHADPAKGQADGAVIYRGICATCHDSPLRAAAVTDLKALKHETDIDYWKYWIAHGKQGSMMPAYAKAEGGPLDDQQILALAAFCFNTFKPAPAKAAQAPGITTNASLTTPAVNISTQPVAK
jgi:cytochrome c553